MYDGNSLPLLSGCPPSTEILGVHQYYDCDLVLFRGACSYLNVPCYSPPDASLTCQSVSAALQTVKDSYDIGGIYVNSLENILNIPFSKEREIRVESTGVDQYREKIVHYYIKTNPNASWDGLAGRLLYSEKNQALENVKRNIIRTKRGTYQCYYE